MKTKKIIKLNESDLTRIVKRVINEDESETLLKKVMRKLKGVSDEQLRYNMSHDLPWDWKGTKEGFYEKMEPRKKNTGSN
jgi:mRNA-degrading endonuclease YafQ of YafQ-DinJ toxin-antitoxin module